MQVSSTPTPPAATPSGSGADAPTPSGTRVVGSIGAGLLSRGEPLLIGGALPGAPATTLEAAMRAAASASRAMDGCAIAVVGPPSRGGAASGAFELFALLQPTWTRGWLRDDALTLGRAMIEPATARRDVRAPSFAYSRWHAAGPDGARTGVAARGGVDLDARSGVQAIVGRDWGLVTGGGQLVPVAPSPA